MNHSTIPATLILGMAAVLMTSGCNQERSARQAVKPASQTKAVDGLTFYYGIVKGAAAAEVPSMHMGKPGPSASYHIVLALFETASKARVIDADVAVRLRQSSEQEAQWLPMTFMPGAGTQSYGRYVSLPSPGRYLIDFRVERATMATPIVAHLVLQRPG